MVPNSPPPSSQVGNPATVDEGEDRPQLHAGVGGAPSVEDFPTLSSLPEIQALLGEGGDNSSFTLSPDIAKLIVDHLDEDLASVAPPPVEDLTSRPIIIPPEMLQSLADLFPKAALERPRSSAAPSSSVVDRGTDKPSSSNAPESVTSAGTTPSGEPSPPSFGTRPSSAPSKVDAASSHTAPSPASLLGAPNAPKPPLSEDSPISRAPATVAHFRPFEPTVGHISSTLRPTPSSTSDDQDVPPQTVFQPHQASVPQVASDEDPVAALGNAIQNRASGALVISTEPSRCRRIVLRDGDIITAASDLDDDALMVFLVDSGHLIPEMAATIPDGKLPSSGRHAVAAMIARGFLGQDELWPILRAHAAWILGRTLMDVPAQMNLEREIPEHLRDEPSVFGGAAGVEVFVETLRQVISPEQAAARLGGPQTQMHNGPQISLLAESALSATDENLARQANGQSLDQLMVGNDPSMLAVFYALVSLKILSCRDSSPKLVKHEAPPLDPQDSADVRSQVQARLVLVEEGDYFSLLGLNSNANEEEVRHAFVQLRKHFEPHRLITAATADLAEDLTLIIEVLEEAYDILRDPLRRQRYRKAIEATPPN